MTIVERVARAMAALRGDAEDDEAIMDLYGDLATAAVETMLVAAIGSMQEPSEQDY